MGGSGIGDREGIGPRRGEPGARSATRALSLAQALTANKVYGEALKLYEQLEAIPGLRDKALMAQAGIYKIQGKQPDVVRILEKLSNGEITSTLQARAAIQLAEYFADADAPDRAIAMLKKLATKTELIDNLVSLNTVAFKLGDDFLESRSIPRRSAPTARCIRARRC